MLESSNLQYRNAAICRSAVFAKAISSRSPEVMHGTDGAPSFAHDGRDLSRRNRRVLRDRAQLCLGVHPPMSPWELVMGSIMAVGLTAYLVYAMLRPEKF
jgi:K+-transporting ATPase KdpF subunit